MRYLNEWTLEWDGGRNICRINLISQFSGEIKQLKLDINEVDVVMDVVWWLRNKSKSKLSNSDHEGDIFEGAQELIPGFADYF
jgi:hypothetical protein